MNRGLTAFARATIDAPVAAVWDAFLNPEKIRRYMFGTDVVSGWKKGDPIRWKGTWKGRAYEDKGTILELEPEHRITYSHFSPLSGLPDAPENYHTVAIELYSDGSRTIVSLAQDNNTTEEARDHSQQNWSAMLSSLKKLLEANRQNHEGVPRGGVPGGGSAKIIQAPVPMARRLAQFWDQFWKREREFFDSGRGEFRHGTSFVAVSSIAEQYYCEYKLENEFALGEAPTEAKESGSALHDELVPTERISKEEFAELVQRKEPSLAVLGVWGPAGGLKVIGTPDHVIWSEGRPLWVVELKTTRGDPALLWEDQENQVRIYGLLLERMGFDCSKMRLAVVKLKSGELNDDEKAGWILRVSEALLQGKTKWLEMRYPGRMKVHPLRHEPTKTERVVASKAGYWLKEREPTSSTSVGKCRACEYSTSCPRSLSRP